MLQLGQWSRDGLSQLIFAQDASKVKVWAVSGLSAIKEALWVEVANGPGESLRIEIGEF